jgi:DNA mismatch repair protein MutL
MGHIADMVSRMALSRPDVHFILRHNQRELKNWPAAANSVDRVADVLGMALRAELHRLEGSVAEVSVAGWLSGSRYTRRTASAIYQFVNGRPVKDRLIMHALLEGYHGRLMKGLFPVAVLRLKVPFDQVDVNVHPAKNEVRFLDARKVHQAIRTLVRQTLLTADQSELGSTPSSNRPAIPDRSIEPAVFNPSSLAETPERFQASAQQVGKPAIPWSQSSRKPAPLSNAPDPEPTRQSPLWQDKPFSSLRVIGQIHNTYIVCESPEGVILIDQHAAHERILFEQLRAQKHAAKPLAQNLLMPETVELSLKEADLLNAHLDLLQRLGFHIEPFGGDTYIVKAVPALLAGGAVEPLLRELLENWEIAGGRSAAAEMMDASLKTMACHTALRAREDLTGAEIKALLQQLDACHNPSHCPHGRPTWIRWTSQELQKAFHRIV